MKKYIDAERLIELIIDATPICSADGANEEDHDLFIVGEAFAHVSGKEVNTMNDLINRQAALAAIARAEDYGPERTIATLSACYQRILNLPPAQKTIYGYDIEHLAMIAEVLQKEDLPPERVAEALNDIGRIVAIVTNEFEETLRKAVEQCTI